MKNLLLMLILTVSSFGILAQKSASLKMESLTPTKPIICYSAPGDANTHIGPPREYLELRKNISGRVKTANIIVTYEGFSTEAEQAFQTAVDIWETLISSPVPIRITARWTNLANGVLGSASPASYYINFDGAQKLNVWYPVALAEKVARKELNASSDADIVANFNSNNASWYLGTTGTPPGGQYDLVTVVLHEIGHGLGITKSYEVASNAGQIIDFFQGYPVIYDSFLENATGQSLHRNFSSPSTTLGTQLTSNNLFFNSKLVLAKNNNANAKIYAPSTYAAGSSIAHLDETTFSMGSSNSLMTPFINPTEVIHNPGSVGMALLKDMGWSSAAIKHTPLKSTETVNADFQVVCQIDSDTAYNASSVKLNYTLDGTNFTAITMAPTANPNEFKGTIPKPTNTGAVTSYGYYLSVNDNAQRSFTNPGIRYSQGSTTTRQDIYPFTAGPDTSPPKITHSITSFLKQTETSWKVSAILTDNIGINNAIVEYFINDGAQSIAMLNTKDSTYEATITLALAPGDKVKYRIKATDNSVAKNIRYSPASGYHDVNVVSLAATRDFYASDFNTTNNDFFGDTQFSITKPAGFNDNAIHTVHPYPNGSGANKESNYVYQLGVPIRLKATDAIMKFDEIVLVEPGENGSVFGTAEFFDYVIVEGSKDGGVTWKKLLDGYDSRAQADWLAKWNSSNDGNTTAPNSTGEGNPTLFKSRTINMTAPNNFVAGDEIVIRFRLFADELAHGWGWAIDNLKIQVDDVPPTVLHNHTDFLPANASVFTIATKATDGGGLGSLTFEYKVNEGSSTSALATITNGVDQYSLDITLTGSGLKAGDEIQYRIKAKDKVGNETTLPATGFFKVPLLDFSTTLTTYSSDFNSANTDFAGNFFEVNSNTVLENGAINSAHPYPLGFGLTGNSDFRFMLKKPIVVSSTNPNIVFSEILIAEYTGLGVKDYGVVEGSKDNGQTWEALVETYSASAYPEWRTAFDNKGPGSVGLYRTRLFSITQNGKFKTGDVILIRFRLFSDGANNGWGWAIDNLSIQGTVTGIEEKSSDLNISVFPNPAKDGKVSIVINDLTSSDINLSFINSQGATITSETYDVVNGQFEKEFHVGDWSNGIYLIRVQSGSRTFIKKFIKAQ